MQEVEALLAEFIGDIDPEDPKGRRRRDILEAATELFAAHGYRKTSMTDIAAQGGVAKATLYLHFKSKSEVLIAAVALEKLKTLAPFAAAFDTALPARARLRIWIERALLVVARSPLLSRLVSGDEEMVAFLADVSAEVIAESSARQFGIFGDLVAEAIAPEVVDAHELRRRVTAMSTLFYVAPILRLDHIRHGLTLEELAGSLADLVVDGICRRKE